MANPFLVKDSIAATVATTTTWFDSSSNSLDLTAANSPTLDTLGDVVSEYNPFWTLDGVDQYLSVANDADLNFGADTDFSLEWVGKTSGAATTHLINKGNFAGGQKRYDLTMQGDGTVDMDIDDNVTPKTASSTATINDGLWHQIIATMDRDGNMQIYIDGAADGSAVDISAVVDIDSAADPLAIGIRSSNLTDNPFSGDIALVRIWNRVLSSGEVSTLYNGSDFWKVQAPTADQWGSQTDITPTGQAWSDSNTEGNSVGELTETLCSISSVTAAGETPAATHAGTWMVKMALAAGSSYCGDSFSTVIGKKYRASGWCYVPAGTGGFTQLRVGTSLNNNDLGAESYTTRDAWVYVQVEYTVTTTTTYISFLNGAPSGNMYVDDVVNVQIGAVAEYRLVHTNSFSPFEFEKSRFLPVSEPSVPRQISGPAGGGQVKVASLGDDLENFPFRINRVSSTNKTNFEGFIKDSTVDRGLNTFVFVDESAIETTVRWLTPTAQAQPLNNIQAPGGRFNLVGNFRKEIT